MKNKEVFVKHEKAPTAPRFEGVLTISHMPMFWKIKACGHFWPTSGGRKCQKAHLHTITFHLNLFKCLYDHPLQKNSLEKLMFRPRLSKGTSIRLDLSYEPIPRNSLEISCFEKPLFLDILAKFDHFR